MADPELEAPAKANTFDNFLIVFTKKFLTTVLSRMDANADIFKAINDDKGFAEDLKASYGRTSTWCCRSRGLSESALARAARASGPPPRRTRLGECDEGIR